MALNLLKPCKQIVISQPSTLEAGVVQLRTIDVISQLWTRFRSLDQASKNLKHFPGQFIVQYEYPREPTPVCFVLPVYSTNPPRNGTHASNASILNDLDALISKVFLFSLYRSGSKTVITQEQVQGLWQ